MLEQRISHDCHLPYSEALTLGPRSPWRDSRPTAGQFLETANNCPGAFPVQSNQSTAHTLTASSIGLSCSGPSAPALVTQGQVVGNS